MQKKERFGKTRYQHGSGAEVHVSVATYLGRPFASAVTDHACNDHNSQTWSSGEKALLVRGAENFQQQFSGVIGKCTQKRSFVTKYQTHSHSPASHPELRNTNSILLSSSPSPPFLYIWGSLAADHSRQVLPCPPFLTTI
jgi:hypothetical protein